MKDMNINDNLLESAIGFAARKHAGQLRKGTSIPYFTHVMEAMEIVSRMTEDEAVRAAAVLHDTLEDTDTKKTDLIRFFGLRVANLVAAESEDKREDQPAEETWWTRKQETIEHLSKASTEAKIIALGDKLSNVRAMHRDYQVIGEELWQRFNEKDPIMQGMYYGLLANVFWEDEFIRETPAYKEYVELCADLFGKEYDGDGNLIEEDDASGTAGENDAVQEEEDDSLHIRAFYSDAMEDLAGMGTPWALILDRTEDPELLEIQKMAMTLDALMRTEETGFGNVHLQLINEPGTDDVSWKRTKDGYALHLCAESGKNWCQVAYQLGYLMTHCLIDHLDKSEKEGISWAEELVCEASAIDLLYKLCNRWDETPFSGEDPGYAEHIREYIDELLDDEGNSAIWGCEDRAGLEEINERNSFDDRLDESHELYRAMEEDDLLRLVKIREYEADSLLLYTHYWRSFSDGSCAVDYICTLQETIEGCDIPSGISQTFHLKDSNPTAEQIELYGRMIRSMRPLPCEYIIFSFQGSDKGLEDEPGLQFYQVCREKDGRIDAEIRIDSDSDRKMYRRYVNDDQAVAIMKQILETGEAPDPEDWKDITEKVFPSKDEDYPELPETAALLLDIRFHSEKYYPLVDHNTWKFDSRTKSGDVNIGWNIGVLDGNRPWFAECWARDQITMLTYFISTKDLEGKSEDELVNMLEQAGIVKFTEENHRSVQVSTFTDSNGNEFYSVNIVVGVEDETYLTHDSGKILPFKILNELNVMYKEEQEE